MRVLGVPPQLVHAKYVGPLFIPSTNVRAVSEFQPRPVVAKLLVISLRARRFRTFRRSLHFDFLNQFDRVKIITQENTSKSFAEFSYFSFFIQHREILGIQTFLVRRAVAGLL